MTAPGLQTRLRQEEPELKAVVEPQLAKNGRQVRLDRSFADEKPRGDVPIARARAAEPGDLTLTRGQQGKTPVGPDGRFRELLRVQRALLDEQRDQSPLGPDFAMANAVYGLSQERSVDFSLAIAAGACLEACDPLHVIRRGRNHDDPGLSGDAANDRKVSDSARMEKLRVQQHHARVQSRNRPVQGLPSGDFVGGTGALKVFLDLAAKIRSGTGDDHGQRINPALLFIGATKGGKRGGGRNVW